MKVCDYIASFLQTNHVSHVFTVSGAGDLYMLDALRRQTGLAYVCNHHEQASAMAAYAYACVTSSLGVALVTTGPGGTNAITGVCSAWVDSVPVLVLSGQVKRADMIGATGVRQRGIQEINIVDIVRPCTKYAAVVLAPEEIRYQLEYAFWMARTGRPGPVWLDVLMLSSCAATGLAMGYCSVMQIHRLFNSAKRPVLGWSVALLAMFLSGLGIYVGRFLRWRSIDIAHDPFRLLGDIAERAANPFVHYRAWAVTLGFGVMLSLGYAFLMLRGEQTTPPNGGPATRSGNSGVTEGPPSAS